MKDFKVTTTIILVLSMIMLSLIILSSRVIAANYHDYYGAYSNDDWHEPEELIDVIPTSPMVRTFGGCYIAQDTGTLLDDLDCDKVADIVDNCRNLANPDQLDQNSNGLGDACDLVVEAIEIDPEVVVEGRSFMVKTRIMNNKDTNVRNMLLKIQIPELGLEDSKIINQIDAGTLEEYEFMLRAPTCVSANEFGLVLSVEFPTMPGVKEFFYVPTKIQFLHSSICDPNYIGPGSGKTQIDIIEMQDIDSVKGGIYPFTIKNTADESEAYILQAEGNSDWGTVEIQPGSLIVVPAGETRQGQLIVKNYPDAEGTKGFMLTIKSKDDAKQVLLNANIKKEDIPIPSNNLRWMYAIVFIVFILALIAVYEVTQKAKEKKNSRN